MNEPNSTKIKIEYGTTQKKSAKTKRKRRKAMSKKLKIAGQRPFLRRRNIGKQRPKRKPFYRKPEKIVIQNGSQIPLHVVSMFWQIGYTVQTSAWRKTTYYTDVFQRGCCLYHNYTYKGENMRQLQGLPNRDWNGVEHWRMKLDGVIFPSTVDCSGTHPVYATVELHQLLACPEPSVPPGEGLTSWSWSYSWYGRLAIRSDQEIDCGVSYESTCIQGQQTDPIILRTNLKVPSVSGYPRITAAWIDYGWFSLPIIGSALEPKSDYDWRQDFFTELDFNAMSAYFIRLIGGEPNIFEPYKFETFEKARNESIEQLRWLDVNTAAYLRDLKELPKLIKLAKDIKRHPLSSKTWIDLYFQFRYGLRLFLQDTEKVVKEAQLMNSAYLRQGRNPLERDGRGRASAHETRNGLDVSMTQVVQLFGQAPFEGTPLQTLHKYLVTLDLWPSLHNIYDFIPYSFVVDWFLPVDDVLTEIDKHNLLDTLEVKDIGASFKLKVSAQTHFVGNICFSVDFIHYLRRALPFEELYAYFAFPAGLLGGFSNAKWSIIHAFDGFALVRQRNH